MRSSFCHLSLVVNHQSPTLIRLRLVILRCLAPSLFPFISHHCYVVLNLEFTFLFQIYVLVVVFALYNGLVFLPVLLSLFGPSQRPEKKFEAVPMKTLSRGIEAADAEAESFVRTNQENNDASENGLA